MLDALPRHVGDVQQAIDAAEVDERAVIGEVLDHALDDCAFLQLLEQFGALGAVFLLDDRTTRNDDVVALLVELDDLEFEHLAFEVDGSRTGRTSTSEPGRNARTKSISTVKPPLTRPLMMPLMTSCFSNACLEALPGAGTLGFFAREARFAGAVFDAVECDFDVVADADFDLAALVLELCDGDDGFALESCVDDDDVGADFDHATDENLARA